MAVNSGVSTQNSNKIKMLEKKFPYYCYMGNGKYAFYTLYSPYQGGYEHHLEKVFIFDGESLVDISPATPIEIGKSKISPSWIYLKIKNNKLHVLSIYSYFSVSDYIMREWWSAGRYGGVTDAIYPIGNDGKISTTAESQKTPSAALYNAVSAATGKTALQFDGNKVIEYNNYLYFVVTFGAYQVGASSPSPNGFALAKYDYSTNTATAIKLIENAQFKLDVMHDMYEKNGKIHVLFGPSGSYTTASTHHHYVVDADTMTLEDETSEIWDEYGIMILNNEAYKESDGKRYLYYYMPVGKGTVFAKVEITIDENGRYHRQDLSQTNIKGFIAGCENPILNARKWLPLTTEGNTTTPTNTIDGLGTRARTTIPNEGNILFVSEQRKNIIHIENTLFSAQVGNALESANISR